ncbi:MAG TPA: hypothetical protein VGE31_00025 [Candidatus Paceibacterota bacterium]
MASNLFSFNPFSGVSAGITPVTDLYDFKRQRLRPAHIACGDQFIQIDNTWQAPPYREGKLFEANLRTIAPPGKRAFEVVSQKQSTIDALYLFVDTTIEAEGVRSRITADMVNATAQIEITDGVRIVMHDVLSGKAFLEFHKEGGTVFLWTPDGWIYRLIRENGEIKNRPLRPVEIAEMRTAHFREILRGMNHLLPEQLRRCHGIISSAVRLLRYTRDAEARDVLVDFFLEQSGPKMTDRIREDIRIILLEVGHENACMFLSPEYASGDSKACCSRRKPSQKRLARSTHDRELRQQMRGPSGGKTPPKSSVR